MFLERGGAVLKLKKAPIINVVDTLKHQIHFNYKFLISIYLHSKLKTQRHKQKVKNDFGNSTDLELRTLRNL